MFRSTPQEPAERIAYSIVETAQVLGASRAWVYERIHDGTIPTVKIAGRRFVPRDRLEHMLHGGQVAS